MRFEGTIKTWNDERGFGFIAPEQGGDDIFLHIKAFGSRIGRPQVGQRVSFAIELGPQGKKRAMNVEPARKARPAQRTGRVEIPAQWSLMSAGAIPLFAVVYVAASIVWQVPVWYAAIYLGASITCFAAYAFDKSAAVSGRERTRESTLLLLGLACGWPGAIVAQQLLRHKSSKQEFRRAFWMTVVLNFAGFIFIASTSFSTLLSR